ncbi:MAG: hypothetical protein JXA24_02390 [Proteobacteria bacterium]|nr:hypothetical protein [Pseudomonadota bacterium]
MQETPPAESRPAAEAAQAEAAPKRLAVGVKFRTAGHIYTFLTDDPTLKGGERVLVEAEEGTSFGVVAAPPREARESELPHNARKLIRRLTEEDAEEAARQRERALECFKACRERIKSRSLPMKLVDVEMSEGGKKAVFVFFAEDRVDFRALVKDLAGLLRMRIEMRQVGSRDESRMIGCIGPCGLTTCCSTHLRQFKSISISMAKHQGLAPNPAKLTGMCGKLKCCLDYESAAYDECRHGLPKVGAAVRSPKGPGKVIGHNVLKRECTVRLYGGGELRISCDQCQTMSQDEREAAIGAARQAREEGEERRRMGGRGRRRERGRREPINAKGPEKK